MMIKQTQIICRLAADKLSVFEHFVALHLRSSEDNNGTTLINF